MKDNKKIESFNTIKKEKKDRVSFFEKIKYINEHGYMPFVIRFSKVTIFSVTFECLLTVFILEMFAILTKYFVCDPTKIPKLMVIVLFPFSIELIVCILFGIIISLIFTQTVYSFSCKIEEGNPKFQKLKDITNKYKLFLKLGHIAGFFFYFITTIIIPKILIHFYPDRFKELATNRLVFFMGLGGVVLGLIWNITGYYRNRRIMWHKLLPQFKDLKEQVIKVNFECMVKNFIGNIISIVFLFSMSIFILWNLHPELRNGEILTKLFSDYNFLFIAFAGLFGIYVKGIYKMIYANKDKDNLLFSSLEQLFDDD